MDKNSAYNVAATLTAAMIQAGWIADPIPSSMPAASGDDERKIDEIVSLYFLMAKKLIQPGAPSRQNPVRGE